MEIKDIISALGALAQETRLSIFRLLVEAGPQGLAVGAIAERLGVPNATLSFHLKELTNAGLTIATPTGRSIIYATNFSTMNGVVEYLTENCCVGAGCAPGKSSVAVCEVGKYTAGTQKNPATILKRKKS